MARYLYSELSSLVQARRNCASKNNDEWFTKHTETIESLVDDLLPSGSGFDSGTKINLDASHAEKLVFTTAFHHMDENGYYNGWTEHTVTVTPSLHGAFNLRISGRNRNDIKEMMYQEFDYALRQDTRYYLWREQFPEMVVTHKWEDDEGKPSQCYQKWYVLGERFTSFQDAIDKAADLMEERFYKRGLVVT
jgi:hypothetical protein